MKKVLLGIAAVLVVLYVIGVSSPKPPERSRFSEIEEGCRKQFTTVDEQRSCAVEISLREREADRQAKVDAAAQ